MMTTAAPAGEHESSVHDRRSWLEVLADADPAELAALADADLEQEVFDWLRLPETGLVMAQGRIGNTGARFNLAEVPVTRCAVRSRWRTAGVGYVTGRRPDHAVRVARLDALLQVAELSPPLCSRIVVPLTRRRLAKWTAEASTAASSRVTFFTLAPEVKR